MANLLSSLRRRSGTEVQRSSPWPTISLEQWGQQWFGYGGLDYPYMPSVGTPALQTTLGGQREEIGADFRGYIEGAYKSNGVVFACILARLLVFSEARFQYRQLRSGRPGDLFGQASLGILERPWPNGTTGDLLARMIQDADLAGNFYGARRRDNLKRMRPDWVTIIMGSDVRPDQDAAAHDLDLEVLGYAYHPGGKQAEADPVILLREEVAHFAPIPDPSATFRGMSWLTPVIRETMADSAATSHKLQFFENGATPNMVVSLDKEIKPEASERLQSAIAQRYAGMHNAYETMVLGGGASVQVVGADMKQIDFKVTQGHGETRIAAAAGVPPIIVGLSEGLEAATYSNYGQAKRRFADGTLRPLWRNAAGSLASVVSVPSGAELWYDDRDIPFLQEDIEDAAKIQSMEAGTTRTLIEAGFQPDDVVDAVTAGDLRRLKGKHSGLVPVQLQPPGVEAPAPDAPSDDDADPVAGRALLTAHLNGRTA